MPWLSVLYDPLFMITARFFIYIYKNIYGDSNVTLLPSPLWASNSADRSSWPSNQTGETLRRLPRSQSKSSGRPRDPKVEARHVRAQRLSRLATRTPIVNPRSPFPTI
jgi:hypothetical protein